MDFFKKNDNTQSQQLSGAPQEQSKGQGGGFLSNMMHGASGAPQDQVSGHGGVAPASSGTGGGGLMGKFNNALGGGASGEKKEDGLDKAVDYVQEHVFKQGPQTNESAAEQMKDETISDSIRNQYKNMTGKDFPIADK
ncbi:hypothetical protein E1B28_001961 [Marasmius oreades]|uniref:DNA damage-responsive protein 48 n=1 Tax=Marasmius oreades TaxID=181124 RepID=A0A9P8AG09_9AGAR|nr:uncharacterized protein E1B28_001961 [Marasmius oreades]KAG7100184.1 hypothetical protein E1B28_001961 [Marasmius oreades]